MNRLISLLLMAIISITAATAQNVTINATNSPANKVFADIMKQTNVNFVYRADILKGVKVSVSAKNQPLRKVLDKMFEGTNITYKIKGNNVTLQAVKKAATPTKYITISGFVRDSDTKEALVGATVTASGVGVTTNVHGFYSLHIPTGSTTINVRYAGYDTSSRAIEKSNKDIALDFALSVVHELEEFVVVGSHNHAIATDSPEIGSSNLSSAIIKATPVIFGESDVVKTIQLEPGVSAGVEGMAGMYVHGGNSDENLYMLDNIPLYQVNHFFGLFSAFNSSALRNVDFYKSSFPAKYDGRLSSYMDVHTKDGSLESHHGSLTLGLTSAAFNLDGPIKKGKTSYSIAARRSWYDVLTIPASKLISAKQDDKLTLQYAFMDINAKINHNFSERSRAFVNFYFGDDLVNTTTEDGTTMDTWYEKDKYKMHWGNIVASAGWNYVYSSKLFGEVTAAYTRYYSSLSRDWYDEEISDGTKTYSNDIIKTDNNINDWIFRADYEWQPSSSHKVNFGASYTIHSFLPARNTRTLSTHIGSYQTTDSVWRYRAHEANAYIGDDWRLNKHLRANFGIHASLFNIEGKTHTALSPRLSLRYRIREDIAVKGGYSRTTQYIHQLDKSYISLPTDQWVPITNNFKPQTCDKVFAGGYWNINKYYTLSVEAYYKWLNNLVDYYDTYYLLPTQMAWDKRLTSGKGTAKGVDIKVSKDIGRITGQLSYSLMWADRTFEGKNNGKTFPARFDTRHKINALVMYHINDIWELNASWTGQSGNMYTLSTQSWDNSTDLLFVVNVNQGINNYRLPFYHRLDLGITRHTHRGYWTISLYNAYCNMNVVALRYGYSTDGRPKFQKLHLIPIIPSFTYTWLF